MQISLSLGKTRRRIGLIHAKQNGIGDRDGRGKIYL